MDKKGNFNVESGASPVSAFRGIGGFKDPNVSAVFIEPAKVVEIRVDPDKTKYDIVQVNRDSDLLLMQSSLQTLRDQFDDLKEYLPLDAVHALELTLLYSSLIEVSPKAARRAREALEIFRKARPEVNTWYERLEELHNRGNIAGLIIPHLIDVHDTIPVPNSTVRRECVNYVRWVCMTMDAIHTTEVKIASLAALPSFQSATLGRKIAIIPMGTLKWSKYGAVEVTCEKRGCTRLVLVAFGPYHGEKAIQASTFVINILPAYSVSHLVVTSVGGRGDVLALYIYIDKDCQRENEMKLQKLWDQAMVLDATSNKAPFELARTGELIIRHSGEAIQTFLIALFAFMSNTDARITECSLWREGAELRIILRISRLTGSRH